MLEDPTRGEVLFAITGTVIGLMVVAIAIYVVAFRLTRRQRIVAAKKEETMTAGAILMALVVVLVALSVLAVAWYCGDSEAA